MAAEWQDFPHKDFEAMTVERVRPSSGPGLALIWHLLPVCRDPAPISPHECGFSGCLLLCTLPLCLFVCLFIYLFVCVFQCRMSHSAQSTFSIEPRRAASERVVASTSRLTLILTESASESADL